jgi:hypothetical protein
MNSFSSAWSELAEAVAESAPEPGAHELGYQSWTEDNLCVESFHEETRYFTSRWDALCPYVDVNPDMLRLARKPFIVYALPPEGPYGVPINDKYGLVDVAAPGFWVDARRERKFRELDKMFRGFEVTEMVIPGREITAQYLFEIGEVHFASYDIHDREIEGFVDYVRKLDVVVIKVTAPNGDVVLHDVSVVLPQRNQVYGSFCQWNPDYRNRSPGIYACLLAARWTAKNNYRHYNLGPVGDYGYKSLFVTDFEPIYGLALTDLNHALVLDETSPLHTDFKRSEWNQIYRNPLARSTT